MKKSSGFEVFSPSLAPNGTPGPLKHEKTEGFFKILGIVAQTWHSSFFFSSFFFYSFFFHSLFFPLSSFFFFYFFFLLSSLSFLILLFLLFSFSASSKRLKL